MPFDDATRRRLNTFVGQARDLLAEEFAWQLQQTYGMDPGTGEVSGLDRLGHLDDQRLETARTLREILAHYLGPIISPSTADRQRVLVRIVREQAFTVLNRLAALRLMEARGLLLESVAKGYQSRAFRLYQSIAGPALGETGDTYRVFLFSLFDTFAADLPGLFDRHSPFGHLFPRESALLPLLELINAPELEPLWGEDETIGWIYQYFNSREERKVMREASQAPRDSRELAVRNQFFTPRYVVEFLVDNTLGRLWLNWTGSRTGLRDRCQYLLVKPDEQPEAAKRLRDPRTIKLLDPACGSMHFGLYAFDLFLEIYREAWEWEQAHGPGALDRETGGRLGLKPLAEDYADQVAFLRDVPRLIVEHNIYGVDIDPRAAQIASLALWLRAQRAWHEAGVKATDRPQVGQGRVLAAVAPPAEVDLRKRFMEKLDPLDAELFEQTLFMLKGLPELGVLLRVERELPALIRKVFGEHGPMFSKEDMAQWQNAEARLREALTNYAGAARSTYQGRLFAEDALQGLRMIDHCSEMFDVVVMNPPFGALSDGSRVYLETNFPHSKNDLLMIFVERGTDLLRSGGTLGAITSRNCLFQSNGQKWREHVVLGQAGPVVVADLGFSVMDDALVEAAAYCLMKGFFGSSVWYRLVNSDDKKGDLLSEKERFLIENASIFDALPMKPFAYWVPQSISDLFRKIRTFESEERNARCGMGTLDDFRFVRVWWEVSDLRSWTPYAKGEISAFVTDINTIVNFRDSGKEIKTFVTQKVGSASRKIQAESFYFRRGLQYGRRMRNPSPAILPEGCIFSDSANALFISGDDPEDLYAYLSLLNSDLVKAVLTALTPVRKMEVGFLQKFPIPEVSGADAELVEYARQNSRASMRNVMQVETSRYFVLPNVRSEARSRFAYSRAVSELFGVPEEDVDFLIRQSQITINSEEGQDDEELVSGEDEETCAPAESERKFEEKPGHFVQTWSVGVAFGRFDWHLATGERDTPPPPEPFDPLPAKSPGMLPDGAAPFHHYDGILVDDHGHQHDLPRLIEEVLGLVQTDVPSDVRRWLRRDFFPLHLKQYSRSRRKAPIYWPLSTVSGSYTLWLYYPSLTSQTLYAAVNDFVEPKLKQVGRDAVTLRDQGAARSHDDEKAFEALQALELELSELRDELLRIAPSYRPNHDDGVQITAAPLWRLFRHRPWQTILKDTWAKLEKGDYDWAHLAMAYRPAQVREKCRSDRSLAIAHDLEHLYEPPPEDADKPKRGRRKKD